MERRTARWAHGVACAVLLSQSGVLFLSAFPAAKLRSKKYAGDEFSVAAKPQLLNADTNPTLRYPVASFSGRSIFSISYGWFDITRQGVRYSVVDPAKKRNESFEASVPEVTDMKMQAGYLEFRTSGKRRMILYLPQYSWGGIHSGPKALREARENEVSTAMIGQAIRNFEMTLAGVRPPPPKPEPVAPATATRAAPVVSPPVPPTIVLLEPSVTEPNATLELSDSSLTVRGVAMDPSGIPVVTINGTSANMKPRNAQATEFWSDALALAPGDNRIEVDATNAANAQAKVIFLARYSPKVVAPPPPASATALGKEEILNLLRNNLGSADVADLVKKYGIKFTPSETDLKEVQDAGGGADLIEAIKRAPVASIP